MSIDCENKQREKERVKTASTLDALANVLVFPTFSNEEPPEFPPIDINDEPTHWRQQLVDNCTRFNENHALVLCGGKHRIMRTGVDIHGRAVIEFISQADMELMYQSEIIQIGFKVNKEPKFDNVIGAWAKHKDSRRYTNGVVFAPKAIAPQGYFNTWRGFNVEPKENAELLKPIFYHIDNVVCDGNKELSMYFYKWVAFTLQYPEKPAGSALVLQGEKGGGKGTIGHFLMSIWGNHALHISNAKHLVGNFNGHLADTCFLFADEAFYSGDKQHEGVLKALITEKTIMIERKGVDPILQANYLKVFMATNNDWAVPASSDERRFCVFKVSNKRCGDRAYFNALHDSVNDKETQAAFLHEMLNLDLSDFHTGDIPESEGLHDQRMFSLDSIGQWLLDSVHNEHFDTKDGGFIWEERMSAKDLYKSYIYFCDQQKIGEYGRKTQTALGRYLSKKLNRKKVQMVNGNHWELGSVEDFKIAMEKAEKITI